MSFTLTIPPAAHAGLSKLNNIKQAGPNRAGEVSAPKGSKFEGGKLKYEPVHGTVDQVKVTIVEDPQRDAELKAYLEAEIAAMSPK